MIKISQAAADEIQRLKSKQKQKNLLFSLAVKPGGCCGWFYDMAFKDEQTFTDGDRVFICNNIQIVISTETLEHIRDLTIEYSEDLMGGGFRFYNSQANSVCSCGNSFSVSSEQ
ncbi:iron-sulfur cluster assembly accessory protein [Rivularia sp. UHCC 0363]|uniref:HesB/IscA family protein n=1 Tax=Rivularia sp. UHCC 0363 TaxID=3110244 RepID=UPI002B1FB24C|nr:iron-sulfur cluster assembly accessory protein [Rivularia sp. UHCC 0363]MEA5593934.1 iron-sulfur cluster assembly accessory protein [Rivularia sp. UHCC 0363]